jgi:hypothetical protein
MAGQYGASAQPKASHAGVGATNPVSNMEHEHGYEWEQAREQERLERESAGAGNPPPPGYDVAASKCASLYFELVAKCMLAANNTGATHYAPPAGPPPGAAKTH